MFQFSSRTLRTSDSIIDVLLSDKRPELAPNRNKVNTKIVKKTQILYCILRRQGSNVCHVRIFSDLERTQISSSRILSTIRDALQLCCPYQTCLRTALFDKKMSSISLLRKGGLRLSSLSCPSLRAKQTESELIEYKIHLY